MERLRKIADALTAIIVDTDGYTSVERIAAAQVVVEILQTWPTLDDDTK